jgi:ParB family chromosome partitioning protein
MTARPKLIDLDPHTLDVHPGNVRRDLGDLRALTRSVAERGVRVPLLVVPGEHGRHLIVAGHRRHAAAIAAGSTTVPCIVHRDLDSEADQIIDMLTENVHRQALTAGEEAAAYEQLAGFGLSDTAIARATGTKRKHVATSRQVAASEIATTVATRYDLSLEQALVLAEFDDDRDAIKTLTVTARQDPGRFDHVASRLRQDRERAARRAATIAALHDAGVTILDHDYRHAHPDATRLSDLTDTDDGTPITPEDHARCPGHAAHLHDLQPDEVTYLCVEPAAHDHRRRTQRDGHTAPTPMSDEEKAERREVIENNKAWRAAEPVRRAHITGLLARKTPPKGTLRFATTAVLQRPDRVGDGSDELLAELLGVEAPATWGRHVGAALLATTTEQRLPLALLAQVAADHEAAMGTNTWRTTSHIAAAWLSFLTTTGYTLSDIEQHVVDIATEAAAAA